MKKFLKNTNGAVTVFVTLLLIPSILVSGTAVDLARIHTARSIVHDANQLALNTLLTQYNALLHDIYGLFGLAEDDPILWELLNNYISVTVFGEDSQDRSLGTLQVFYGADLQMEEVLFADDKNLRNMDVLRRQIEDYMKYRGPVLIVTEFLDALDGNMIKSDSVIIGDKLNIESGIAELIEKYKVLYEAIDKTDNIKNPIKGISGGSFGAVSSGLRAIRDDFVSLKSIYDGWAKAMLDAAEGAENDTDAENDAEARSAAAAAAAEGFAASFIATLGRISARVVGGSNTGLNRTIENAKRQADNFKPNFDRVVDIAKEIDEVREMLLSAVDELESKLNSGECSDELKVAFSESYGDPAMTLIERYRQILEWDNLGEMAQAYSKAGYEYIDNEVKPMLDGVRYRDRSNESAGSLSREELAGLPSDSRFYIGNAGDLVALFGGFSADNVTYPMPPGFLPFAEISIRHFEFFELLTAIMEQPQTVPVKLFDGQADEGGKNAEEQQRNLINTLLKMVDTAYEGMTNQPLGAMYIDNAGAQARQNVGASEIVGLLTEALGSDALSIVQSPMESMSSIWEYLLLLSYCTGVFSNYATARPDSIGKTREDIDTIGFPKSITGVPMSPEVNYFFQSEWEYLYEGKKNADENLDAVKRLIFLIRMVCNYIAVFSVSSVNAVINAIKAAFALAPPLALVLGELARAAFVAAESLIDVSLLRSGYKVPLIKRARENQWICTPAGLANAISKVQGDGQDGLYDRGLTYNNYMIILLVTGAVFSREAGAVLADRTADLIEWNIINYQHHVFSDEGKMAQALSSEGRFRLIDMKTDISITTRADMRMLFLSMLFAQNFAASRGTAAPRAMPVTVTDYRGY